jgi:hypothetical protein
MLTQSNPPVDGRAVLDVALGYLEGGLSLLPIRLDGSKAPSCDSWTPFTISPPSREEVQTWFAGARPPGVGIIGGAVSGNLAVVDFEFADFWEEFRALLEGARPGLLGHLPVVKTPGKDEGGGRHVYFRARQPVATGKLARLTEAEAQRRTGDPKRTTAVEVKGQGGYVLTPPCPPECHPTRRLYSHIAGPPLTDVPVLEDDEVDAILAAARSLNRAVKPSQEWMPKVAPGAAGEGLRPGDDFNHRAPWDGILVPHGWRKVADYGDSARWCRPGKTDGVSATTGFCKDAAGNPALYVFSTNCHPLEDERLYSKFAAFCLLNYGGDFAAAAQALLAHGYGVPATPAGRIVHGSAGVNGHAGGPAPPRVVPKKMSELRRLAGADKWLWHGLIPSGCVSILSALPKAGKTTLVVHLLKVCQQGGDFCGQKVRPCRVLVVTEESETIWAERRDTVPLADHVQVVLRPFRTKPTAREWDAFLLELNGWLRANPTDLLVVDTLSKLWPVENENDASEVTGAVMPLLEIAYGLGISLLLVHHLRKSTGLEGTQTRGSGALVAAVDAVLELRRFDPVNRKDNRRTITCDSRFGDRLDELVVELVIGGYVTCGDREDVSDRDLIETIRNILPAKPPGMSLREIKDNWPEDTVPRKNRLLTALRLGTDAGRWQRLGAGTRGNAFSYWCPGDSVSVPTPRAGTETESATAESQQNPLPCMDESQLDAATDESESNHGRVRAESDSVSVPTPRAGTETESDTVESES